MKTSQKTLAVVAILIALCALAVVLVSAAPATPTITKTVTPTAIKPDCAECVLTYTIVLSGAEAAVMTDTLPTALTFDKWLTQPEGAVNLGDVITWTGTLTTTSPVTLSFTAKLPKGETLQGLVGQGKIVNTAYVNGVAASATTNFYRYIFLPLVMRNFAG